MTDTRELVERLRVRHECTAGFTLQIFIPEDYDLDLEAADTIERLQRERKEVLTLGRECELSITGDPYEESAVTTHEIAMQAIREALRLGLERNNEANALRTELAARDKTIEALREDAERSFVDAIDLAIAAQERLIKDMDWNSNIPTGIMGDIRAENLELLKRLRKFYPDAARSEGEKST